MKMQEATIATWGKSTAVRIPSEFVKNSGLRVGQTVRWEKERDGSIRIRPVLERPKLEVLLASVTTANMPDEADISWGKPVGTEVW